MHQNSLHFPKLRIPETLFISHSRNNLRKFTFSNRVPPIWNGLPESVKTAPNVIAFKNAIDKSELIVRNFYDYDE